MEMLFFTLQPSLQFWLKVHDHAALSSSAPRCASLILWDVHETVRCAKTPSGPLIRSAHQTVLEPSATYLRLRLQRQMACFFSRIS